MAGETRQRSLAPVNELSPAGERASLFGVLILAAAVRLMIVLVRS